MAVVPLQWSYSTSATRLYRRFTLSAPQLLRENSCAKQNDQLTADRRTDRPTDRQTYTVFRKTRKTRRHQTRGRNKSVNSRPIVRLFSHSDSAVNLQQSTYYRSHRTSYASLPYLVEQLCQKMSDCRQLM